LFIISEIHFVGSQLKPSVSAEAYSNDEKIIIETINKIMEILGGME
jgi:hypothetical protein